MNPLKLKLLEELLMHMDHSRGSDLKGRLDSERMPNPPMKGMDEKDPKGLSIEKVSVLGKKPDEEDPMPGVTKMAGDMDPMGDQDEDDLTDSELEELLKKYMV